MYKLVKVLFLVVSILIFPVWSYGFQSELSFKRKDNSGMQLEHLQNTLLHGLL